MDDTRPWGTGGQGRWGYGHVALRVVSSGRRFVASLVYAKIFKNK